MLPVQVCRPHRAITVELAPLVTEVVELVVASRGGIRVAREVGVDEISRLFHAEPVESVLRMQVGIEHKAQCVQAIVQHVPALLVSVQNELSVSLSELETAPIRQYPLVRLNVSKSQGHLEVDVGHARHLAVVGAQRGVNLLEHCDKNVNLASL